MSSFLESSVHLEQAVSVTGYWAHKLQQKGLVVKVVECKKTCLHSLLVPKLRDVDPSY